MGYRSNNRSRDSNYSGGHRRGGYDSRYRKDSRDFNRSKDDHRHKKGGKGGRHHKKNQNANPNRDLDSEIRNYWIKGGKKVDDDGVDFAQKKLNEEMDDYWKEKKEEEPAEKTEKTDKK